MQGRRGGVKAFFNGALGKILLIVIAILAVLGAFLVGGVLLAIVAVLVFGLGIPIGLGLTQPRYLAILGVAVLVVSPALITAVEVPLILAPPGVSGSSDGVMQNATVSPFTASAGTNFTWTVQIFPSNLPPMNRTINLTLYVSTCPGATGNSSPYCSSGYPLYWIGLSQHVMANLTKTTTETINFTVPTANIWNWQMGLYYGQWNTTTGKWDHLTYDLLSGDPSYNSIEGPITADWGGVYYLLVGSIYLSMLLYLGLVFFIALLIYMLFRLRRQRRQQALQRARPPPPAAAGATPLTSSPGEAGGPAPGPPSTAVGTPLPKEVGCPNCGAVVYPNETFCWKCGAALGAKAGTAPTPKG